MKTIILVRHGKSDLIDHFINDHDRPLTNEGINAAEKMGKYLSRKNEIPDIVISLLLPLFDQININDIYLYANKYKIISKTFTNIIIIFNISKFIVLKLYKVLCHVLLRK